MTGQLNLPPWMQHLIDTGQAKIVKRESGPDSVTITLPSKRRHPSRP